MAIRQFSAAAHSLALAPSRRLAALGGVGLIAMMSACGSDGTTVRPANHGGTAAAGGTIEGRVTVRGPLPAVEPVRMGTDPTCVQVAGSVTTNDEGVVAADGAVANAFVGVLDHPFFAVTGIDGRFTFTGVPDGHYIVEMWHERFGKVTDEATIADQQFARADFAIDSE